MKSVRLSQVTGSLSDYARDGLREPVVVTKQGRSAVGPKPPARRWSGVVPSEHDSDLTCPVVD